MISILIIVPTLNSYKLLAPLVESLQAQTLDTWRLVFIDGPSNQAHRNWLELVCLRDPRFQWRTQEDIEGGIFGAMNQGFSIAKHSDDWLLFWGSDDRAASPFCLERAARILMNCNKASLMPDMLVCSGIYFSSKDSDDNSNARDYTRRSRFVWRSSYAFSLFCGSTPPHQATLIGPGARRKQNRYDTRYLLAADLDFFLSLSRFSDLNVVVNDLDLVLMGDSGVSAKQNRRRLSEVIRAYRQRFGFRWLIPFMFRYVQRIHSTFIL
jgi:glycosyltransferase involved in cell wall biosynthesis